MLGLIVGIISFSSVDLVDFVYTLRFLVTFFLSFLKGQLLVSIFGALLSGSCILSHIAWIVTCEQIL